MFGLKFDHTEGRFPVNGVKHTIVDGKLKRAPNGERGETTIASLAITVPAGGGQILAMAHAEFQKVEAVANGAATCFIELPLTQGEIDANNAEIAANPGVNIDDIELPFPPHPTIEHYVSEGFTYYTPFTAHNLTLIAGFTVANVAEDTRIVTFVGKSNRLHPGVILNPRLTVLFSDGATTI